MIVIPAIDLQNGKCVRLYKGKIDKLTIYYNDPIDAAQKFVEQGTKVIHIIDLDGAYGKGDNFPIIKKLIENLSVEIQVGGGIRTIEKAVELYNLGVERVICGTAAIKDPLFVNNLVEKMDSKHIVVALDHRGGKTLVNGWQKDTDINVFDIAKQMEKRGAGYILFSSAEVDGTLAGPDTENTKKMVNSVKIPVIAAGGISSITDIITVKQTGAYGAIIGKALYEGFFDLKQAIEVSE